MPKIDIEASDYIRDILKRPTERDKQRKVGASQLSNLCSKCLGEAMATGANHQSKYNLGAITGTAIHSYIEDRNQDLNALKEFNGLIDIIPGYGEITSTTDIYRVDKRQVLDIKTTTRDKLDGYLRDWETDTPNSTLTRYFYQAHLYAYMIEADVESVGIVFVCRDGQIVDRDVVGISMPYREEIAVSVMDRAKRLWAWLEANDYDWTQLDSHDDCFVCNNVRPILESEEVDDL